MSLIEFDNVTFSYPQLDGEETNAVKNLSFCINEGDFVALVGHNGSGKSTAAKLANGLLLPKSGKVTVNGMSTLDEGSLFDIRKTLGVVFQNPDNQMIATIIEDDIAFGPENLGLAPNEIDKRVDWALDLVGMGEHRMGTPFRLSGGQKQRIAIAGVLAIKPKVIIFDESTAMLDPIGREEIMRVVLDLRQKENITVIMITHFMDEAALADRIIVLNKGEKLFDGGKEILLRSKELEKIGMDVPPAVSLAQKLRDRGLSIKDDVFDIEALAEELCR